MDYMIDGMKSSEPIVLPENNPAPQELHPVTKAVLELWISQRMEVFVQRSVEFKLEEMISDLETKFLKQISK